MNILFVHQNFPGQFPHLARALAGRGHRVLALTAEGNRRPSPVPVAFYRAPAPVSVDPPLTRLYAEVSERGLRAARAARVLRDRDGYRPDLIVGHPGWGETLYLKEVWPEARLLVYAELMYRSTGSDVDFDPEFQRDAFTRRISATARGAHLIQTLVQADAAISPTAFQASTFPAGLRDKISVCHDGIDTDAIRPDPGASFAVPGSDVTLHAGEEVLTFVSRSLEPYRGYHSFMRALPAVLTARPRARVVIVGAEGQSYGPPPPSGSWKRIFLDEVRDRIDLSRVHFTGRIARPALTALLQASRVHCYLSYPFVLSWSLLEAMAAGAMVVGSDTAPLREVIRDGENGRLVNFFDIAGLAAALSAALADPQRFQPCRTQARADMVAHYDLNRVCLPRLLEIIERETARAPAPERFPD